MASSVNEFNFKNELAYPLNAIAMEDIDCQKTTDIKFKIPILMTEIPELEPVENKGQKISTSHIVNKQKIQPEKYNTRNYIELNVAQEFAFMCPRDEADIIEKHQEFIAVCMNGELANIRIIGRNF